MLCAQVRVRVTDLRIVALSRLAYTLSEGNRRRSRRAARGGGRVRVRVWIGLCKGHQRRGEIKLLLP